MKVSALNIILRSCQHPQKLIKSLLITLLPLFISPLIVSCAGDGGAPSVSPERKEAGGELLSWLESRVELMVQSKASCEEMASKLAQGHHSSERERKRWRELKAGEWLAQEGLRDPNFGRRLNQLIIKGDLVHSYCAYQSKFRDQLSAAIASPQP